MLHPVEMLFRHLDSEGERAVCEGEALFQMRMRLDEGASTVRAIAFVACLLNELCFNVFQRKLTDTPLLVSLVGMCFGGLGFSG